MAEVDDDELARRLQLLAHPMHDLVGAAKEQETLQAHAEDALAQLLEFRMGGGTALQLGVQGGAGEFHLHAGHPAIVQHEQHAGHHHAQRHAGDEAIAGHHRHDQHDQEIIPARQSAAADQPFIE